MQHTFKPTLLFSFICLMLFGVFISLGMWQLGRIDEKEQQQKTIDLHKNSPATSLKNHEIPHIAPHKNVIITGQYDIEKQFMLDNIQHNGKLGYYIFTPFQISNSEHSVLINRGWVEKTQSLPILPNMPAPQGTITVEGVLANPRSKPVVIGNADSPLSSTQSLWYYMDLAFFEQHVNYPVLPLVVRLNPNPSSDLIRHWPTFKANTGMHIGYAIQWFVFAFFVLLGFLNNSVTKRASL